MHLGHYLQRDATSPSFIAENDEGQDRAAGRVAEQGGDGAAAAGRSRGRVAPSAAAARATAGATAARRGALHAEEAQQQAQTNLLNDTNLSCWTTGLPVYFDTLMSWDL